jgi:transposase-like protein
MDKFPISWIKSLSPESIVNMDDASARKAFFFLRWESTSGAPTCPRCGDMEIYSYKKRPIFKCKKCAHQFTATSGTIFSSRKMSYKNYLLALMFLTKKPQSALQLSRSLGIQYRTAWALANKIRSNMEAA